MSRTVIDHEFDVASLRPVGDYVLVRILEREKSQAGLFLVRTSATPCVLGEVLAVGSGVVDDADGCVYPIGLDRGDVVLFMDYARDGSRIEVRSGHYALIRSHGIWAKVTPKDVESYELDAVEPRMDMIVVRPQDEKVTKAGIHLPQGQKTEDGMRLAEVVAVGPGQWESGKRRRRPVEVGVGDHVFMTRYAGADIDVGGETLRIINETDVQAGWED